MKFLVFMRGSGNSLKAMVDGSITYGRGESRQEALGRLFVHHPELFSAPDGLMPSKKARMFTGQGLIAGDYENVGRKILKDLGAFGLSHLHDLTASSVLVWGEKRCGHPDCVIRRIMET